MKILTYTTLLLVLTFMALPCKSQETENNHNDLYKEVNKSHNSVQILELEDVPHSAIITEVVPVDKLDATLKNMVGVLDIKQGGRSILNKDIALKISSGSPNASKAFFGCIESLERLPQAGKGKPEPGKAGFPTVKRKAGAPAPALKAAPQPSTPKPVIASKELSEAERKLFRTADVSLVDNADKAYLKKYSIVIGTFTSLNNANFVKRTFNGLGERPILVKSNTKTGTYHALVGSSDSEADAIKKYEAFNKKYVEGLTKSKRITKYGISLDDMWIVNTK